MSNAAMEEQPPWVTGAHIEPTLEDLSIDDSLTQLERVKRYVASTIPLQRLVHVKLLAGTVIESSLADTRTQLLPLVPSIAKDEKFVVRQHTCDQIVRIAQHLIEQFSPEGYRLVLECLLPPLALLVNDEKEEVRQAASEALVQVANHMDKQDLGRHILTVVLQLAHDDEKEELRVTAASLLNDLAPVLGKELCSQFLMAEIVSLSEDPSVRVRKAAAWNMHQLCSISLSIEGSTSRVLSAYDQLTQDDSHRVRRACVDVLPDISKAVNLETRKSAIIPIYRRLSQDSQESVRTDMQNNLGNFIATLEPELVSDKLVQTFASLAHPDVSMELRQKCAFQFPAVAITIGAARWTEIQDAYQMLVDSEDQQIRRTLSFSLHEIAKIVGTAVTEAELLATFEGFLRDTEDIRVGVVHHLAEFFHQLSPTIRESYLGTLSDTLEQTSPMNWRLRESIASQLPQFSALFEFQSNMTCVLPLACQLLRDPVSQVREISLKSMPTFLKLLVSKMNDSESAATQQDVDAFVQKLMEFLTADTFADRQMFIYITDLLTHASITPAMRDFVETYFHIHLPALAKDPVFSVRIVLATMLSSAPAWTKPSEPFESALANLQSEPSFDIQYALHHPHRRMSMFEEDVPPPTPEFGPRTSFHTAAFDLAPPTENDHKSLLQIDDEPLLEGSSD